MNQQFLKLQRVSVFLIGVFIVGLTYLKNRSENTLREIYAENSRVPLWFFRTYYTNAVKLWSILFVSMVIVVIMTVLLSDIFSTRELVIVQSPYLNVYEYGNKGKKNEKGLNSQYYHPLPKTLQIFLNEIKTRRMIMWVSLSVLYILLFTTLYNNTAIDAKRLTDIDYCVSRNTLYYWCMTVGVISIGVASYIFFDY